jgi:hypothetical protein
MPQKPEDQALSVTDVLKRFPGLVPTRLYYWEKRGWVKPIRTRRGSLQVRSYPPAEVKKMGAALSLIEEGYSPRAAFLQTETFRAAGSLSAKMERFAGLLIDLNRLEAEGKLADVSRGVLLATLVDYFGYVDGTRLDELPRDLVKDFVAKLIQKNDAATKRTEGADREAMKPRTVKI